VNQSITKYLKKELEKILKAYKGEKPFNAIIDPVAWQKEIGCGSFANSIIHFI
jgi:hypothetical protein